MDGFDVVEMHTFQAVELLARITVTISSDLDFVPDNVSLPVDVGQVSCFNKANLVTAFDLPSVETAVDSILDIILTFITIFGFDLK